MTVDLKSLGQHFRERREESNLTLKEVENATSIRMSYLQAIEDGRAEDLISPVYAQGFLRQYAIFLGMDGDDILKENQHLFADPDKQEFDYGIGTLEPRGGQSGGVLWIPNVTWTMALPVILAAAWFLAKYLEVI